MENEDVRRGNSSPHGRPSPGIFLCATARTCARLERGQVPTLAPLVREVTPAVVNISVHGKVREDNPLYKDPLFREFFEMPKQFEKEISATGSGVNPSSMRNEPRFDPTINYGHVLTAVSLGRTAQIQIRHWRTTAQSTPCRRSRNGEHCLEVTNLPPGRVDIFQRSYPFQSP
jgi:S1-C subfamily serine protease